MSDSENHWRFCEIIERTKIPGPTIATPPETEKVILEQHTATGEYRLQSLETVLAEASESP